MEEFFKQPFLERLYDSISEDFEKSILTDEQESKKYYDIAEEEEKLYDMLKRILGVSNDEKKLKELMEVIREIEEYCCQETDYWNRKYFKLGVTYMLQVQTPVDRTKKNKKQEDKKEEVSNLLHNFLNSLRENEIEENQKNKFFDFIESLKIGTKLQKRRFCLYYNFDKDRLSYTEISKKERCTSDAAAYSIKRFIQLLICMESEKDTKELLKLIQNK